MEPTKGDSLEGSDDTPIYNPHIIPLRFDDRQKVSVILLDGQSVYNLWTFALNEHWTPFEAEKNGKYSYRGSSLFPFYLLSMIFRFTYHF